MKLTRKLYPNSNDKEVVSMSINDLVEFAQDTLYALNMDVISGDEETLKKMVNEKLSAIGLKTPASHQKQTKKQKTEEKNDTNLRVTGNEIMEMLEKVEEEFNTEENTNS
jgi:hypothetical protein